MKKLILLIALLAAVAVVGAGCTTTVLAPEDGPAATYRLGTLKTTISSDIGTVYQAAGQAVQDLGLNVVQTSQDELEGRIAARTAQDEKVTIEMTALTSGTTRMEIDAGSLARARRIYEAILANLGGPGGAGGAETQQGQ